MKNLLLEKVEYKIEKTRWGLWCRFLYPTGAHFAEFKSHGRLLGSPLIHYARGINPETGKRILAKGIIAVGHPGGWYCPRSTPLPPQDLPRR
jgi:hypothetical protein